MEINNLTEYLSCIKRNYVRINNRDSIPKENLDSHIKEYEENKHLKIVYNEATGAMEILK